jgi:hypothetical protein
MNRSRDENKTPSLATEVLLTTRTSLPVALRIARASFIDWQGLGLRKEVRPRRTLADFVGPLLYQHNKKPRGCRYIILEDSAPVLRAGLESSDGIPVRTVMGRHLLQFRIGHGEGVNLASALRGLNVEAVGWIERFHSAGVTASSSAAPGPGLPSLSCAACPLLQSRPPLAAPSQAIAWPGLFGPACCGLKGNGVGRLERGHHSDYRCTLPKSKQTSWSLLRA